MKPQSLLLSLLLIWTGFAWAQTPYQLESGEMTIAGTSTIHDWESTVTEWQVDGDFILQGRSLQQIEQLSVRVPVPGIISGRGNTMDKKTWKALQSEEYPDIVYTLREVEKIEPIDGGFSLSLKGELAVAGVTRPIDLTVVGRVQDNQRLAFSAEKALDMTDFGIVPPKALFGTLQTGEVVTVGFSLILAPTLEVE